jgi:ADP-ribose pyrophosphatase
VIEKWQRLASKLLLDLRILKVLEVTASSKRGIAPHPFYVFDTVDWINVLPITSDGQVVFVKQYRHGSDEISLEIPGGMVDPGEGPEAAAARECLEESGFSASGLISLGALRPNPAIFNNFLHTFVAFDVQHAGEIQNTATEETELVLLDLEVLPQMMLDGEIDHALVVATIWRYFYARAHGLMPSDHRVDR